MKKIIATVGAIAMAASMFTSLTVSAGSAVPTINGVYDSANSVYSISISGLDDYTARYVDSLTFVLSLPEDFDTYFDMESLYVDPIEDNIVYEKTGNDNVMYNKTQATSAVDCGVKYAFTPTSKPAKFQLGSSTIKVVDLPLVPLAGLDKELSGFSVSAMSLTSRSSQGGGNYLYIGTTDVGNVNNNLNKELSAETTSTKVGIQIATNFAPIKAAGEEIKKTGDESETDLAVGAIKEYAAGVSGTIDFTGTATLVGGGTKKFKKTVSVPTISGAAKVGLIVSFDGSVYSDFVID